jgi:hypothetical protein
VPVLGASKVVNILRYLDNSAFRLSAFESLSPSHLFLVISRSYECGQVSHTGTEGQRRPQKSAQSGLLPSPSLDVLFVVHLRFRTDTRPSKFALKQGDAAEGVSASVGGASVQAEAV